MLPLRQRLWLQFCLPFASHWFWPWRNHAVSGSHLHITTLSDFPKNSGQPIAGEAHDCGSGLQDSLQLFPDMAEAGYIAFELLRP